jgi:deoxyribose-phosphate aldolase
MQKPCPGDRVFALHFNQLISQTDPSMHLLPAYIDHTLLHPTASETDIRKCCEEAWIHQFKAICIAPSYVKYVREMMEFCPTHIETVTVIGFPFGYATTATKIQEAKQALQDGATELDIVINMSQFKSMAYLSVQEELTELVQLTHAHQALAKIIIETAYLDSFELHTACEMCVEAKADFVKTSTGYAPEGASVEIVRTLKSILPQTVKIKASGGIRNYDQAWALIEAGADRIGTSKAVDMVQH